MLLKLIHHMSIVWKYIIIEKYVNFEKAKVINVPDFQILSPFLWKKMDVYASWNDKSSLILYHIHKFFVR